MNTNTNLDVITLAKMKTKAAGYVAIGYACQTQITVHRSSSTCKVKTKLVTEEARCSVAGGAMCYKKVNIMHACDEGNGRENNCALRMQ